VREGKEWIGRVGKGKGRRGARREGKGRKRGGTYFYGEGLGGKGREGKERGVRRGGRKREGLTMLPQPLTPSTAWHYLVKLEMLIANVLPLGCYRKKLQNLFHLNCGPQICQICIQLITACGSIVREDVQNTHHWSERTEIATENGVGQAGWRRHCGSHSSVASLIAPDQWCVFYSLSLVIFPQMLLSTGLKSGEFGWHSWGWINSGVSFFKQLNGIARAQRAFQVSQGSVETLFRWGEKCLRHFAVNLFRKRCTKFYRNRPSCVDYKNIFVSFSKHVHVASFAVVILGFFPACMVMT